MAGKKHSMTRGAGHDHPGSLPSQKQQRLAQYNMHHTNHNGLMTSSELLSSAEGLSNHGLHAQASNVPMIAAANFHPYNRSMKMQS